MIGDKIIGKLVCIYLKILLDIVYLKLIDIGFVKIILILFFVNLLINFFILIGLFNLIFFEL